jgi:cbb3-type cytochrome oxidase subunit 1
MRDPAFVLLASAGLCVLAGMLWGIRMGITGDHLLASAHAHLNLVGWVTLALFGFYYRLTPAACASRLARVHAVVAILGVLVLVPGIALAIQGGPPGMAIAGALLSLLSMVLFLLSLFRFGFGGSDR